MAINHLFFLFFICLIWGFTFVAGKASVSELPPIFFSALRYMLISAVLVMFLKPVKGKMKEIAFISVTMGSLHFALFYGGMSVAENVSSIAVATQLGVPFSTILSIIFLGEVVRWRRWLGIILAFVGIMIISFDPEVVNERLGLLLVLGAVFCASFGTIVMKRVSDIGVFQMQAWIGVLSWPPLLLVSFLFEQDQMVALQSASWMAIGGIFYTALGASLIGHAGMYYLLQRYDVSVVSPLTLMAPIFGICFGVFVWGDDLGLRFWIGSAFTLIGVLVIALRKGDHPIEGARL